MLRLNDRSRQIPGGLKFFEPATKWSPVPWSSFSTIVDSLINHRRANSFLAQKNHWALDRPTVEAEVDTYNAAICKAHGWTQYYTEDGEGGPTPKARSPHSAVGVAVVGISALARMFGTDGPIRDKAQANARAKVCIACPKHDKGDWKALFTEPAQALVMKMLGAVKDLDLKTDYDDQLMVCSACYCPMKGKVWSRLDHILKHIPAEDKAALDPGCWITSEEKALRNNDKTTAT